MRADNGSMTHVGDSDTGSMSYLQEDHPGRFGFKTVHVLKGLGAAALAGAEAAIGYAFYKNYTDSNLQSPLIGTICALGFGVLGECLLKIVLPQKARHWVHSKKVAVGTEVLEAGIQTWLNISNQTALTILPYTFAAQGAAALTSDLYAIGYKLRNEKKGRDYFTVRNRNLLLEGKKDSAWTLALWTVLKGLAGTGLYIGGRVFHVDKHLDLKLKLASDLGAFLIGHTGGVLGMNLLNRLGKHYKFSEENYGIFGKPDGWEGTAKHKWIKFSGNIISTVAKYGGGALILSSNIFAFGTLGFLSGFRKENEKINFERKQKPEKLKAHKFSILTNEPLFHVSRTERAWKMIKTQMTVNNAIKGFIAASFLGYVISTFATNSLPADIGFAGFVGTTLCSYGLTRWAHAYKTKHKNPLINSANFYLKKFPDYFVYAFLYLFRHLELGDISLDQAYNNKEYLSYSLACLGFILFGATIGINRANQDIQLNREKEKKFRPRTNPSVLLAIAGHETFKIFMRKFFPLTN